MGLGNGDVTVGVCPAIGLSVGVVALSDILPEERVVKRHEAASLLTTTLMSLKYYLRVITT